MESAEKMTPEEIKSILQQARHLSRKNRKAWAKKNGIPWELMKISYEENEKGWGRWKQK